MEPCPLCRRAFASHLTLVVRSRVRWRGSSFDAYQAQGKLGLAVARALGYDPRERESFARFVGEVSIRDFREKGAIPQGRFDPLEGEIWEFHVGFANAQDPAALYRVGRAAVDALRSIPNYEEVYLDKGSPRTS